MRNALVFALAAAASACSVQEDPQSYGDPTALSAETTVGGITAKIISPEATSAIAEPVVDLVLSAYTEGDTEDLEVVVSTPNGAPQAAKTSGKPGPSQRFSASVALLHGQNSVQIEIRNKARTRFRRLQYGLEYSGSAPGVAFTLLEPTEGGACDGASPITRPVTRAASICVRGRVTAGSGKVTSVKVGGEAAKLAEGKFEALLPLDADKTQKIDVSASDAGHTTKVSAELTQDSTPPAVEVTAPDPTTTFFTEEELLDIEGTAADPAGLKTLRVDLSTGGSQLIAPASPWKAQLRLSPGDNVLNVVATDTVGNVSETQVKVVRTRRLVLRAPRGNKGATQLSLDKKAMAALFDEEAQKTISLAAIPLRPSIVSALRAIREPEKNNVDTSTWGQAEKNLNKLLNMTPDTANLVGTSVEELLGLAAAIGLPPQRVLGELFQIGVTDTFVGLEATADVIIDQLIKTHPNAELDEKGQPIIKVSLYDVFQDLHPLSARFGPSGSHPGFLSGETESKVLESGFAMSVPVSSSLSEYDGVEAAKGSRASIFIGSGGDVLKLDFKSKDFSIVGLADEPAIDLRFEMKENPGFLAGGTTQSANPDPDNPGFARGDGAVWGASPWEVERIVAETVYREKRVLFADTGYQRTLRYDAGSIKDASVISWDKGWVIINTSGGIGAPPRPQYAWDMLVETAQIRLHDGGLTEGQADVAFALRGLPVGLTADELIARVKPSLEAQSAKLSELLVGTQGLAASTCDFFYANAGSADYLLFRDKGDGGAYPYDKPGFYADSGLSKKVSKAGAVSGLADEVHEKVAAAAGQSFFFQNADKKVYVVDVLEKTAEGLVVKVAPGAGR